MRKPDMSYPPVCMECYEVISGKQLVKYHAEEYCKDCLPKVIARLKKRKAIKKRLFNSDSVVYEGQWMNGEE